MECYFTKTVSVPSRPVNVYNNTADLQQVTWTIEPAALQKPTLRDLHCSYAIRGVTALDFLPSWFYIQELWNSTVDHIEHLALCKIAVLWYILSLSRVSLKCWYTLLPPKCFSGHSFPRNGPSSLCDCCSWKESVLLETVKTRRRGIVSPCARPATFAHSLPLRSMLYTEHTQPGLMWCSASTINYFFFLGMSVRGLCWPWQQKNSL